MYLYFLCVWFWKALAQAVLLPMSWHKRLGVLAHLQQLTDEPTNYRIRPIRNKKVEKTFAVGGDEWRIPSHPSLQYFNASVSPTQHPPLTTFPSAIKACGSPSPTSQKQQRRCLLTTLTISIKTTFPISHVHHCTQQICRKWCHFKSLIWQRRPRSQN